MAGKNDLRNQLGCLFLFAFPFALVGMITFGCGVWTVFDWYRMQSWEQVPASLLNVRLETKHGDDSTTYLAVAKYRYSYQGKWYTGDRVAIGRNADNLGDYHQRKVDELRQRKQLRETVPCFVNPSNPNESILYREIRFAKLAFYVLFAVLFGGVGFGIMLAGCVGKRRVQRTDALRDEHPDEPWLWRDDWARGEVTATTKSTMFVAIGFATFWNLVSAPVWYFVPDEFRQGNHLALIALIFPIVGLGLAVWASRCFWRWKKFGDSMFRMGAVPGVVGGPLAGVIETSIHLQPTDGFRQQLSCVRRTVRQSGDGETEQERIIWQTTRVMNREMAEHDPSKSVVPVQFHIPFDAEPSAADGRSVYWKLEVTADVPGVDYYAAFEVPVFRTAASDEDYQLDESAVAPFVRDVPVLDHYETSKVLREETAGGLRIRFPLFRHLGSTIGLTAFLAIWTGAIALMFHLGAPIFFPIVFGLFELLLAYFAIEMWLWRSEVHVGRQQVLLKSGILGLAKTTAIERRDVTDIRTSKGMQSGQTLYFDLHLVTRGGKEHCVGRRIAGAAAADAIADDVRRAIGLIDDEAHQVDDEQLVEFAAVE